MSELLPIVFSRGQNESIDPRVAPPEVHYVANNVRWRKDGRPAKRYGYSSISLTGFEQNSSNYLLHPVNAICTWNDEPLLACGSGVRARANGQWSQVQGNFLTLNPTVLVELPHWGPGERQTVVSPDTYVLQHASVGYVAGYVVYAWSDGTNLYICVKDTSGAIIVYPHQRTTGAYPRCVSCGSRVHVISRNGTSVNVDTFDPAIPGFFSNNTGLMTLGSANQNYDAIGRSGDFIVAYQSGASTITISRFVSASPVGAAANTQALATGTATTARIAVAADATNSTYVAWLNESTGAVRWATYNNGLSALLGAPATVQTDANNKDQPSLVINVTGGAELFWGGFDSTNAFSYMRWALVTNTSGVFGAITQANHLSPASKPFFGPTSGSLTAPFDSLYIWAHDHNTTTIPSKWDDQRLFYLVAIFDASAVSPVVRQLHVPRVAASWFTTNDHMADIVSTPAGYFCGLINTTRFASYAGSNEAYSLESISFHSIFESQRYAARDTAICGRATQFSGGALFEFNGYLEETGFASAPVIQSVTGQAGGSMTTSATYIYVAVFEWIDQQGRRHRSTPSDPFLYSSGANNAALVRVMTLVSESRGTFASAQHSCIHLYRTLAGGSTFHRVTPNTGANLAYIPTSFAFDILDTLSDTNASVAEFVYTDGGVVPNTLPPPSTFMCVCNGRLWLGGQLDRTIITASKILVDGEPTQFNDEDEFSVFLPQKCTGLASIDGTVVAFARERIYFITGDGPNDQGIGSFNPPTELPTDVGCIDWRSIVETSAGIFFQSKRGIYLLPRGFNAPIFIGAEVEETLSQFPIITSAVLVSNPGTTGKLGEITVRFIAVNAELPTASRVLVYDLRAQGWSVDSESAGQIHQLGGTWADAFVVALCQGVQANPGSLQFEDSTTFADSPNVGGAFIPTQLGTGDIRPFGIAGYGGFDRVVLVGEFRASAFVNIQLAIDGVPQVNRTFAVTGADAADGCVYLDVTPETRLGSAIRVTVSDQGNPGPSEGFIAQALFIEYETVGKTKRLAQARKE